MKSTNLELIAMVRLPTFLLHIKNLITQIACDNPVATGRLFIKIIDIHVIPSRPIIDILLFFVS